MKTGLSWLSFALLVCFFAGAEGADRRLRLAVDHFSRTVTAQDTAYYLVEAYAAGNQAISINLRVGSKADSSVLNIQFPKQVDTPKLFLLKASARQTSFNGDSQLLIVASSVVEEVDVVDSLRVWLHVVKASDQNPKLILDARPIIPLAKNLPQTLEGAIMPAIPGSIRVELESPSKKRATLITDVDKNGLYHVNHVFSEHGLWTAFAVWKRRGAGVGPDSVISAPHDFKVRRSPFRLTIAAEEGFRDPPQPDSLPCWVSGQRIPPSRELRVPDTLAVSGQIHPDYASRAKITIHVKGPNGVTNPDTVVSPDPINGKFNAIFRAGKSGKYEIETSVTDTADINLDSYGNSDEISNGPLYASLSPLPATPTHPPGNCLPATPSGGAISLTADTPAGYAVIVVGYSSSDYDKHLAMAYRVRDALVFSRGFRSKDILLVTLINNQRTVDSPVPPFYKNQELVAEITGFLRRDIGSANFSTHQGLLFFWIGKTRSTDGYFIAGSQETTLSGSPCPLSEGSPLPPSYVLAIYRRALHSLTNPNNTASPPLWRNYDKGIAFLHAGNNSGMLVQSLFNTSLEGCPTSTPDTSLVDLFNTSPPTGFQKYMISSLPWTPTGSSHNINEDYSIACGLGTFPSHFFMELADNYKVRCAFKRGWELTDEYPAIDSDMNGDVDSDVGNVDYGTPSTGEFVLGYKLSRILLTPEIREVTASIIGSPRLGPEGTVFIALDNPNKFPIHHVTLYIEPPKPNGQSDLPNASMQPNQCFMLQPVDSSSLWKAEVDVFKNKGLYRGSVFVEYEDPTGRQGIATAFFERFRHDTPTVIPPPNGGPSVFFDPHIEVGFNYSRGFDPGSVRESQNKPGGVIDVNFLSTAGGHLEYLGLGVASNFDRFLGMFMPISVSAGGTKVLSNFWIYGGFGYELGHAKFIQEDLLYFVGLKYRLLSLKH